MRHKLLSGGPRRGRDVAAPTFTWLARRGHKILYRYCVIVGSSILESTENKQAYSVTTTLLALKWNIALVKIICVKTVRHGGFTFIRKWSFF